MKYELIDAWIRDELDDQSVSEVEAMLKEDAALKQVALQQLRMDAALGEVMADEFTEERRAVGMSQGVMAHLMTEDSESKSLAKSVLTEILEERERMPRPFSGWDWLKAGAVAAMAAIGAVAYFQSVSLKEDPRVVQARENARFVARVANPTGAVWGKELREDGWLNPGRIRLVSGVAEISFNSGARVFLEGPATFDITGADRAFLEKGSLTAEVPPAASGFVINTPRMTVVDIGTRFGVSVVDDGNTEVHVMQGVVEVSRATGNSVPIVLREGLAVRADSRTRSDIQSIDYAGENFALRLPPGTKVRGNPSSYLHFGFNEVGAQLDDGGQGFEGSPYEGSLMTSDINPKTPRRAPGAVGGALVFEKGESLSLPVNSQMHEGCGFTVAGWIKIPARADLRDETTIFGIGGFELDKRWSIACNPSSEFGEVGALRARIGDAFVTGTTDLRDGRWHHVAFRFLGGEDADITTHAHLYVDGELETHSGSVAGRPFEGVEPDTSRIREMRLGGDLGNNGGNASFEGWIDEFYFFDSAVSAQEIQKIAAETGDRNPVLEN